MLAGWEQTKTVASQARLDLLHMQILKCFCPLAELHALDSDFLGSKVGMFNLLFRQRGQEPLDSAYDRSLQTASHATR